MFEQIVYVSKAIEGMDAHAVYDIIRVAHNRNSTHQLTGALVFMDGYFLQVLEGQSDQVRDSYATIAADPRHTCVELRQTTTQRELTFPDEWMALCDGNAMDEATKLKFAYHPGFPATHFDGPKLVAFALACYESYRATGPAPL